MESARVHQTELQLLCPVPDIERRADGSSVAVLAHFNQVALLQSLPAFAALLSRAAQTSDELRAEVQALLEQVTPHSIPPHH
jgi:hypothetical protein